MEYHVQEVNIVDFIYPARHNDDVYALLDSYCENEDDYWIIKRDEQVIMAINRVPTPYPDDYITEEYADEPVFQERLALVDTPYYLSASVYLGFDEVVYRPEELYRLVELFLAIPQRYVFDSYLWTWIEIIRGFTFNGTHFLDFYSSYYGRGPYIDFSTVGLSIPKVSVPDRIIVDWYKGGLSELQTFSYDGKPSTGIARYGVTTIPANSIPQFREIIKKTTSIHFINVSIEKINQLLSLLDMADKENESIIVNGV